MTVARLARRQHGVVALRQLRELGLGDRAVQTRAKAGRLHRIHQGVYAVGHTVLKAEGRMMAAVLAVGPWAVASHRSAARMHGLRPDNRPMVDVTAPGRSGRKRKGITIHRGNLEPRDVATVDGIPCTSVARTLLDLAAGLTERGVERACNQAEILQLFDLGAIDDTLSRANGHRGVGKLTTVIARNRFVDTATANELEEAMFQICRDSDLPQPKVNYWVKGYKADFAWPDIKLIVETDGATTHGTAGAFTGDRKRDRVLLLAEWKVARFTHQEVINTPRAVGAELRDLVEMANVRDVV